MEPELQHEKFIKRCLELARKGLGRTGMNPLVGSVIVHNGRIIGEGYHREYGGPHAEVLAINSVKNKALLPESTLYVNLEPCSHYGKTPPCSLLIKQKKIPRVVFSMEDPNPEVSGRGRRILEEEGIEVTSGILENEARFLNRRFLKNQLLEQPYLILKWAQSSDGFIDRIRKAGDPIQPTWITNQTSRMLVHKWRSEETAITTGVNTLLTDNPSLNVRDWSGKHPVRIIIDRRNRVPDHLRIKDDSVETWIFGPGKDRDLGENTRFFSLEPDYDIRNFLERIYKMGISSLFVEGGLKFINLFINNKLWDEARIFEGRTEFSEGIPAPRLEKSPVFFDIFRNNQLQIKVKGNT